MVAGLTVEDGFNKVNDSCCDAVDDGLGGFGSDDDGDEEQNSERGFSSWNGFERRGKEGRREVIRATVG